MAKSFLYRVFGIGAVPKSILPALRREGMVLLEEGITGTVTYRNFRAPGRRSGYRVSWFVGSLVVTQESFARFAFSKPIVHVPMQTAYLDKLSIETEGNSKLLVAYDASEFDDASSGAVECRFSTPSARRVLDQLRARAK